MSWWMGSKEHPRHLVALSEEGRDGHTRVFARAAGKHLAFPGVGGATQSRDG